MNGVDQYKIDRRRQMVKNLKDRMLDTTISLFTERVVKTNYVKNFMWMGQPIIQYPSDMFVIQELIWDIKPRVILETGMAFGGSLLFYANVMNTLHYGEGRVYGIEIEPRSENMAAIIAHPLAHMIKIFEGSSVDPFIVDQVFNYISSRPCLVILDSNHTHQHVLDELNLYSPLITPGSYIIVMDTAIEFYGKLDKNQDRPWGKGNNPWTAVQEFLKTHKEFVVDKEVEMRSLITAAPDGWLRRVK